MIIKIREFQKKRRKFWACKRDDSWVQTLAIVAVFMALWRFNVIDTFHYYACLIIYAILYMPKNKIYPLNVEERHDGI